MDLPRQGMPKYVEGRKEKLNQPVLRVLVRDCIAHSWSFSCLLCGQVNHLCGRPIGAEREGTRWEDWRTREIRGKTLLAVVSSFRPRTMNVNEPLSVPIISSPPPLPPRRNLPPVPPPPPPIFPAGGELGDHSQTEASLSLSSLEDTEDELTAEQLRKLYDNDEIDRFLTLFSDVGNYLSYKSNSTDWCWQYVTEVQAADSPDTTDTVVLPPGLYENIHEGEGFSSSEETSLPPSVAGTTPSTTPRSKGLATEIAYVTTIHVLLTFCLIHIRDMFFPFFPALDLLPRLLLLVAYEFLQSVFILLLYPFMVLSSPNS